MAPHAVELVLNAYAGKGAYTYNFVCATRVPCDTDVHIVKVAVTSHKHLAAAVFFRRATEEINLCGKGHEDYQVLNGITVYLDEHDIVKKFMDNYNKEN